MGKTAFIFPGQGSQYVGMGRALYDSDRRVKALYDTASAASGVDIAAASFEGPKEELDDDITAQLAVYACNEAHRLAALDAGIAPAAVTGYSMGFYSALVAAGCIGFGDGAAALVRAGRLALEAAGESPGAMAAVIGLDLSEVEAVISEASSAGGVWVSNVNAARQLLVSGERDAVMRAVSLALESGALSAYTLPMGAAYHSPMMAGAAEGFRGYVAGMDFRPPSVPLLSYIGADYVRDADSLRRTVAGQISSRVLWRDSVMRLVADGVEHFVEVGPGEALTRMVRWVDRSVKAASMDTMLKEGALKSAAGR